MNSLTINSKAHQVLARAAAKAREEKPLVKKTGTYGWYLVRSSRDMTRWYSVICNSQTREISCNCPATKPCYHIAAIVPIHSYIARQRRDQAAMDLMEAQAEAANWPVPAADGQENEVPDFFASEDEAERAAEEAALPERLRCSTCGRPANVFFPGAREQLCWEHLQQRAEAEADKDAAQEMLAETEEESFAKDHSDLFGFVPVRRERVKEEW